MAAVAVASSLLAAAPPRVPIARTLRDGRHTSPMDDPYSAADAVLHPIDIAFGGAARRPDARFTALNPLGAPVDGAPAAVVWPAATDAACLHCCGPIHGAPLPAVVARNSRTGAYTLAPALFCSPPCGLAWIEDDWKGDAVGAAMWTRDVYVRCFGAHEPLARAPPRIALALFCHGGRGMTRSQFAAATTGVATGTADVNTGGAVFYAAHAPPFVAYAAVMECRDGSGGASGASGGGASGSASSAGGDNGDASQHSGGGGGMMGTVRGLTRPTERTAPWATQAPTGKPPLLLEFLAQRWSAHEARRDETGGAGITGSGGARDAVPVAPPAVPLVVPPPAPTAVLPAVPPAASIVVPPAAPPVPLIAPHTEVASVSQEAPHSNGVYGTVTAPVQATTTEQEAIEPAAAATPLATMPMTTTPMATTPMAAMPTAMTGAHEDPPVGGATDVMRNAVPVANASPPPAHTDGSGGARDGIVAVAAVVDAGASPPCAAAGGDENDKKPAADSSGGGRKRRRPTAASHTGAASALTSGATSSGAAGGTLVKTGHGGTEAGESKSFSLFRKVL